MITFKNVNFSYAGGEGGKLSEINLQIHKGECVLLCGRSGCGKTTLLRLINGLIPDYFDGNLSGEVYLYDKSIPDMEMYERSHYIGSVFQNPRTQFFNVDTDSEIAFGMENLNVDQKEMHRRMAEATKELNLGALRGRNIFELSGGEKQRIAFASVYAMNPQVYILDEPSSNLDADGVEDLRRQLELIKKQGKTIVIAEHRLYYLMDLADRIVYLNNGKLSKIYTPKEFRAISDNRRYAMGLRELNRTGIHLKKVETSSHEQLEGQAALFSQNTSKPALEIRNLTLKRKKNVIQKSLNFSANYGNIIGITGPNGAGKTTLLRAVCGLHKDFEGEILVNGKPTKAKDRLRQSYMVMQDVNYELFAESVEKECHLGLKNVDDSVVSQTLENLGLAAYKERHPNMLSGGQKQRLAVAVSQVCNKKFLVFDEPTSGLDYDSMRQVAALIQSLAQDAVIFVVTHDEEFLNLVCTELIRLKKRRKFL